jgi:bifunctional non-homologous end joining protein LigD
MPKPLFPDFFPPMMAESAKAPFDSPDWIFEIKLDGYRAITVFDSAGKAHLWSRNGLSLVYYQSGVGSAGRGRRKRRLRL